MDGTEKEYPVNCIRICIETQNEDAEEMQGSINSVALKEAIKFGSRTELLLKINEAFDLIGQPQPHQVLRSFQSENQKGYNSYQSNPKRYQTTKQIETKKGAVKTVDLVMISRGRSEWQGLLKQPDGTIIGRFKTSLECIQQL